jgi:hypothetical protein
MTNSQPRYLAYLVRLWEVDTNGRSVWRASAQSPHTGERHAFADMDLLFDFLEQRTKGEVVSTWRFGESQTADATSDSPPAADDRRS